MQNDLPPIVARPNHKIALTIDGEVRRALTPKDLEGIQGLVGAGLDDDLHFVQRAPDVEPALGRLIGGRMGMETPQEQPAVLPPEGGGEPPIRRMASP